MAALGAAGHGGLQAGPRGLQATVFLELPEAGLYTISIFGVAGGGQSWKADACRKAVWCGGTAVPGSVSVAPAWHPLMTASFGAGRHFFNVTMNSGASVERLRAELKKDSPADYVATLRRLGFDVGAAGPISRSGAVDAMHFIEQRRMEMVGACGDVTAPVVERALAEMAPVAGPGTGRFTGNGPGGTVLPIGQPTTTPVPPVIATPVTTLPAAPVPEPSPGRRPRPTPPPPPPPTIPPQPAGSPVVP
jgi:hypothetical protein